MGKLKKVICPPQEPVKDNSSEGKDKAYWASPSSTSIADGPSCVEPVEETSYSELMIVMFLLIS